MYWLNLAISVTLLILGGILLLYRLMYMFCQGEPWNNPPSLLTWRFTFVVGGATILIAALASPAYECSDSALCEKDYSYFSFLLIIGVFMLALPLTIMCFTWIYSISNNNPDDPVYSQRSHDSNPDTAGGQRGYMSGYDILFLIMGAGILLIDRSLDVCKCP
jgi:hypothetical protein